jgi:SAM-dependent methyltransferase
MHAMPLAEMKSFLDRMGQRTLPLPARRWLSTQWHAYSCRPPLGWVRFGNLRRTTPFSRSWGYDRGLPVDRYYIENFLASHAQDIRGHVLEIANATYTERFGGERVAKSDVLHLVEGNPEATIVADLTCAEQIPSDTFDSIILTQTLLLIYDVRAAVRNLYRILRPGGVVLATVPGITQSTDDTRQWGRYWSFTALSIRRLFEEFFPVGQVEVNAYGNVLAATAFLYGLATEDLRRSELDHHDPDYEVVITLKAVKPEAGKR